MFQSRHASVQRHCGFYLARDGQWYMNLADDEYGDYEDSDTYGPFPSFDNAYDFLHRNFANPGGFNEDKSGRKPAPRRSPRGTPVINPAQWGGRWRVASRYLQRRRAAVTEGQKDLDWGTKKLDKALNDIEEVLIHWAPKGRTPGLADDYPDVAKATNAMSQVGKILGPQIGKLKRLKL